MNKKAPHQSIITLKVEIMDKLHDGRVSGIPYKKISKLYTITGNNYDDCYNKTISFIERLNNENKQ